MRIFFHQDKVSELNVQSLVILNLQSSEIKSNDDRKKYREFVDTVTRNERMLKGFKRDWKMLKRVFSPNREFSDIEALWRGHNVIPTRCDVLIIGGGAIGSSIAYWLKQKVYREEFNVVVIEKDPTVRY